MRFVLPFVFNFFGHLCQNCLRLVQTGNVWRLNTIKHCLVTKHFIVWPHCLVLFDRVCSCLIKFEGHQTFDQTTRNISFVVVFDGRCFVRLDSRIKHVWCAHAYHACSAACIHRYRVLFAYVARSVFWKWRTKKKLWWTLLNIGR